MTFKPNRNRIFTPESPSRFWFDVGSWWLFSKTCSNNNYTGTRLRRYTRGTWNFSVAHSYARKYSPWCPRSGLPLTGNTYTLHWWYGCQPRAGVRRCSSGNGPRFQCSSFRLFACGNLLLRGNACSGHGRNMETHLCGIPAGERRKSSLPYACRDSSHSSAKASTRARHGVDPPRPRGQIKWHKQRQEK